MSEVQPIRNRELLIDDDIRREFRNEIDPLISRVLEARGFTEDRTPIGRISLDSGTVLASNAYRKLLGIGFDGLSTKTTNEVFENERNLVRGDLELSRIGGFSASRLVIKPDQNILVTTNPEARSERKPYRINDVAAESILQDIRAHTDLGYSTSDSPVPAAVVVNELEALHTARSIDRRAQYEVLTSEEHGDIKMTIGETFDLVDKKDGRGIRKYQQNKKRVFELKAIQPVQDGTATFGVRYTSGRNDSELKLTAVMNDVDYSDEEKNVLYRGLLDYFEQYDVRRFGRGVIKNLRTIEDKDSNTLRLG